MNKSGLRERNVEQYGAPSGMVPLTVATPFGGTRAVTMLEYAIMAVVVVAVGLIVLELFTGTMTNLWSKVTGFINKV